VVRLPEAVPKTISVAKNVRQSACSQDAHRKAEDLLQALATVECDFTMGGAAGVPAGLLRDVVIITAELAGRRWLEANADRAADFTGLYVTRLPPPLVELDQILASVLSNRFRLPSATAQAN
jgi:hypothetical protein